MSAFTIGLDMPFFSRGLPPGVLLNVNVPDVPYGQLAGLLGTRLGHRHKAEPVVKAEDPRGRPIYWVGPAGAEQDASHVVPSAPGTAASRPISRRTSASVRSRSSLTTT